MVTQEQISWSNYDVYEGPFFRGTARYKPAVAPTLNDLILEVITATEGGAWNAINMYDRCICTVGLIQWCEGGQYSVSDMLGVLAERGSGLDPLGSVMQDARVNFRRNARGKWRFHFNDKRGEVDTLEEQRAMFFGGASGKKGDWQSFERGFAKNWAAALATVYESPEAIASQRDYTVPRLYGFAVHLARSWLDRPEAKTTQIGQAFTCAYLSFAANNPRRAGEALGNAATSWTDEPWTIDWLVHVLRHLTFDSGVTIYPHRYNAIRPVLERRFGVNLPDHSNELAGLLSTGQIQTILVHKLGYDLGKSGPAGDGVDGAWGPKSKAALADFERRRGFEQSDGLPDKATNEALLKVA